jgi:hypothetical protein
MNCFSLINIENNLKIEDKRKKLIEKSEEISDNIDDNFNLITTLITNL